MPFGIKVASSSFYVYAAISLVWGFGYWYLIGQPHISWLIVGFYVVVALVYVWVGRNLHRGTTVLWIGRILGVVAALGGLSSLGNHSLVTNHPGILALVIVRVLIGVVITISLFLPGVDKKTAYSR
ncbi:MAG: hypothetical protein M3Z28_01905 [Candidatus Dormibacteraeota bacterium]|nr:hypothetical protein [Candidatus Dormibacteraeota bacterium]